MPDKITARDDLPHDMIGKVLHRRLPDEAAGEYLPT
jgi:hypothetical protein